MIAIALFATALVVRAVVGAVFPGPAYPDSYYYAHVAEQLAAGSGFIADYLWNLDDAAGTLTAGATLPVPANGYWMPLAELMQLPAIWLMSPGPLASAISFWIVGALAAPLTYFVGRDAGFGRGTAIAAGLMVAAPAGLAPFMSQPDSFAPFMTLGVLALWLCARGAAGDRRAFAVGGLVVGLAALTRSDGLLLGLPFALVGVREVWRAARGRVGAIGWAPAIACAALFLVVVTPWLVRQLDVYGSLLPGSRTLWLTDYQHLFSFANVPTLDSWLSQGLGQLLSSRIAALLSAVGLFALLPLAVVLAPLGIVGAWVNRRSPAFQPYFFYGAALLAVMVLAFAVLVPHGTFLHASSALVPHTFLLVLAGIAAAVRWVAARRATWSGATATRVFSVAAVAIAFLAAALQTALATRQWADVRQVHTSVAAAMAGAPSSDRFMAVDPGAINYLTGRQGVVTPHDELPVIETVMRQYGIRWLVLESNSIVPALEPVLRGSVRPTWLSSPVAVVAEESQPSLAINASRTIGVPPAAVALPVPAAALYAVCLEATDPRCAQ